MVIRTPRPLEDYSQSVRRFTFRHPNFVTVMTQVLFWVPGNLIFMIMVLLATKGYTATYPEVKFVPALPQVFLAMGVGVLYGGMLGVIDILVDRKAKKRRSLGRKIFLKSLLYTVAFAVAISAAVLAWEQVILGAFYADSGIPIDPRSRSLFISSVAVYTITGNVLISFIKQVNLRFGPGVLIPLLLGKYSDPVEEDRIVMFLDLRSSTTYAEMLGHIKFSQLIQDVFEVVNQQVPKYDAEIYQYVGDEVIFTWKMGKGLDKINCIRIHFAINDAIRERKEYFEEKYQLVPEFKAGVHVGQLTTAEIGEIKRDIAHHGDTMNTTARIQGKSNELGHDLLASEDLVELCQLKDVTGLQLKTLGSIELKGKLESVSVFGVERVRP